MDCQVCSEPATVVVNSVSCCYFCQDNIVEPLFEMELLLQGLSDDKLNQMLGE